MNYQYSGYLRTVLDAPDPAIRDSLDAVVFTAEDLMQWNIEEQEPQREWEHIPVHRTRAGQRMRIEGRFEGIRRLDICSETPRFWVSLSTLGKKDNRFPVDLGKYPVLEVTYRCLSEHARPAWLWTYPGGVHFALLTPTQRWRTVARLIPHHGFPHKVDSLTFRLYSTTRTTEALEIEAVRFRAMSPREAAAVSDDEARLAGLEDVPKYPVLDEFLPLGTFMNAGAAKRLAGKLGLSLEEYWRLALEDIARHHHNCIALEEADALDSGQFRALLDLAEAFQIKLLPMCQFPLDGSEKELREFIGTHVTPHANSATVLAWHIYAPPIEKNFPRLLRVKSLIEEADSQHPVAFLTEYPNGFALFARHFAASGIAHYASHAPWGAADMVHKHLPLGRGQQFWFIAPGFVFPSDTPDWNGCPEMRLMLHLAFANGVKGWFSYAYHGDPGWVSGSCQRSLTGPCLTFSDLWAELGYRMRVFKALTPLFLRAKPELKIQRWFSSAGAKHVQSELPKHVPPTSVYRLQGPDFNAYYVVSNDLIQMATETIEISAKNTRGLAFHDLTEFVRERVWAPMPRTRHLEMFPGQAHIILAAKPAACARWRDVIAQQIIEDDRRQLAIDLELARQYKIELTEVEALAKGRLAFSGERPSPRATGRGNVMDDLATVRKAQDALLDLMYATPALSEARTKLIEASAALCGCDIALCAMLAQGKVDQVERLGQRVLPLAQELAHLRLELRQGRGARIRRSCKALASRTVQALSQIQETS